MSWWFTLSMAVILAAVLGGIVVVGMLVVSWCRHRGTKQPEV